MFESFNAKGLYIADSAVLALYSVGKVTGVAVDMGHGALTVTPVESGRVYYPGRERIGLGGQASGSAAARSLRSAEADPSSRGGAVAPAILPNLAVREPAGLGWRGGAPAERCWSGGVPAREGRPEHHAACHQGRVHARVRDAIGGGQHEGERRQGAAGGE